MISNEEKKDYRIVFIFLEQKTNLNLIKKYVRIKIFVEL